MITPEPEKITLLCENIKELEDKIQITINSKIYNFKYCLVHDIDHEYKLVVVDESMAKIYDIAYDKNKVRITRKGEIEAFIPYPPYWIDVSNVVLSPLSTDDKFIALSPFFFKKKHKKKRWKNKKWYY